MMLAQNCPSLPCVSLLRQELKNKLKLQVLGILQTVTSPKSIPDVLQLLLSTAFSKIEKTNQAEIFSEILFGLLSHSISRDPASPSSVVDGSETDQLTLITARTISLTMDVKVKFLVILKLCPEAARVPDSLGNLLIHYISMMEYPDRDLMRFLCLTYPSSISSKLDNPDLGSVTPLHCVLSKLEVDFELALFMVMSYRHSSRDILPSGKLPLHLVMSLTADDEANAEHQLNLIKLLLIEFPAAAFTEITEEIRILRFTSQTPRVSLPNSEGEIPDQSFSMRVESSKWTPVTKALSSSDLQLKAIFQKFLDEMGARHLQSKIRRY